MEISPYLQAIQQVAGLTRGEKFKTLNGIARKIADELKVRGSTYDIEIHPSSELPGPLVPLVRLQVAKLVKQPQGIVDVLKGDDSMLFKWALRVKWFFDGSIPFFTNAQYFVDHIFPLVSLNHRQLLIKTLGRHLKDTTIADEFYLHLSKMYGREQAKPLLPACSESFIWDRVRENSDIILSIRSVGYLFQKYPDLITNYLKCANRIIQRRYRYYYIYEDFIPQLIKNNVTDFIKIVLLYNRRTTIKKLSAQYTELFLKNGVEALETNPKVFLDIMSLKIVTAKLSKDKFRSILLKLVSDNYETCDPKLIYESLYSYSKYYPEKERKELCLSIFEESRGLPNLLETHDIIGPEILKCLPDEKRIEYAKSKSEFDKSIYTDDNPELQLKIECYRSIEESIPAIKNEGASASTSEDIQIQLKRLIFTCNVNSDTNALLEVLKYIEVYSRNRRDALEALKLIPEYFEITNLSLEHWKIMENILVQARNKHRLRYESYEASRLLFIGMTLHFTHDQPIIGQLNDMITEAITYIIYFHWDKLTAYPHWERNVLILLMEKTALDEMHRDESTLENLLQTIYELNKRNCNKPIGKLHLKLSPKNLPWLVEYIEIVIRNNRMNPYAIQRIKKLIRIYDPKLSKKLKTQHFKKTLTLLKENPQFIIDHWEDYYKKCKDQINDLCVHKFIKLSRWYQILPIKFTEKCLEDFKATENGEISIFLALLLPGSKFERFITPLNPTTPKVDFEDKDAKKINFLRLAIRESFKVADYVTSIDLFLSFFHGHNLQIALRHLINFARRQPENQIIYCGERMIQNGSVAMKKHGIRIICLFANTNQLVEILSNLWRTETHLNIRSLLASEIKNVFIARPNCTTWALMSECIDRVSSEDQKIIDNLIEFRGISSQYEYDYFKKVLALVANSPQQIARMLSQVKDLGSSFPEEYYQQILEAYSLDGTQPKVILNAAWKHLVHAYILHAGDDLELRLNYYSRMIINALSKPFKYADSNKSSDGSSDIRTSVHDNSAKSMLQSATHMLAYSDMDPTTKRLLIKTTSEAFNSVMKPNDAPEFYLDFTFASLFDSNDSDHDIAEKVGAYIPSLINTFSPKYMMDTIAESLVFVLKIIYSSDSFKNRFWGIQLELVKLNTKDSISLAATLLAYHTKDIKLNSWNLVTYNVIIQRLFTTRGIDYIKFKMHIGSYKYFDSRSLSQPWSSSFEKGIENCKCFICR